MSAIAAANSSAYNVLGSLLNDGTASSASANANASVSKSRQKDSENSTSSNPVDTVDLSDTAKAIIARAKFEKTVADDLDAQLQAVTKSNGQGAVLYANSTDQTQLFSKFPDVSQAKGPDKASERLSDPGDFYRSIGDYLDSLIETNRQPDGSVKYFNVKVNDFINVPTNAEEIDYWYKVYGQGNIELAAQRGQIPADDPTGFLEAIQNRTLTFQNAQDIPELNFHNTRTFEGGLIGASSGLTHSYNHAASIFNDPNISYRIDSAGLLISWKKPASAEASVKS